MNSWWPGHIHTHTVAHRSSRLSLSNTQTHSQCLLWNQCVTLMHRPASPSNISHAKRITEIFICPRQQDGKREGDQGKMCDCESEVGEGYQRSGEKKQSWTWDKKRNESREEIRPCWDFLSSVILWRYHAEHIPGQVWQHICLIFVIIWCKYQIFFDVNDFKNKNFSAPISKSENTLRLSLGFWNK